MELIFKIAAVGIVVSVINQILESTGRKEHSTMITIAGLLIVLMMVIKEIAVFFDLLKSLFQF